MKNKTLKDFEKTNEIGNDFVWSEELKAEAIKWVKAYHNSYIVGKALEEQAGKRSFKDIEGKEKEVVDWIKHFFNLTEEELK